MSNTSPSLDYVAAVPADESASSAAERIVTSLQRDLITGAIPIGSWLRHAAIAKEFGVSRTPVREALRVLAAQGVVTIVPNRGARVNGLSSRDIRELGEVRCALQGLAAGLAAERIDDNQLERMRNAWTTFRDALFDASVTDMSELATMWIDANEEFHSVIVEAADNRQLSLTLADLHRRVPRNLSFVAYQSNRHKLVKNLEEHEAIAAAIESHNPQAARRLMTAHFKNANAATARWVDTARRGVVKPAGHLRPNPYDPANHRHDTYVIVLSAGATHANMMAMNVEATREGHVVVVELKRGPHNFASTDMMNELADELLAAAADGARAGVICADGRSFCAGAQFVGESGTRADNFGSIVKSEEASPIGPFYESAVRLFDITIPLVAALHGPAVGAGFGLATACDLRVMLCRGLHGHQLRAPRHPPRIRNLAHAARPRRTGTRGGHPVDRPTHLRRRGIPTRSRRQARRSSRRAVHRDLDRHRDRDRGARSPFSRHAPRCGRASPMRCASNCCTNVRPRTRSPRRRTPRRASPRCSRSGTLCSPANEPRQTSCASAQR